ncbi:inorganic phosphate transporter 1-11-like [Senna tora]|uniref:Inorganic phosphate transporter 1-11-like n=1 Tax=Senna tora TaxID=362788 RepID=A0A834TZ18_9FABA|nr:inorganic phosphate transporter 1-11-like [Senna tora]
MALAVLEALDSARTQWYHITAIVIAGMGFFTDAYDLFCITTITKLLGRLYYFDPSSSKPGKLPPSVNNTVVGVALVGTLCGQLVFGWLGDKLGRKKVYGITLILMVLCAICSGLSFGSTPKAVMNTLCFFRFWLGFGIGGDYPLSATIMSEYANKRTRGAFIAAVFAMQGVGIIFAGLVSVIFSGMFLSSFPAPTYKQNKVLSTQPEGDFLWRIVLMVGAIPAMLTFYWRMKMPETGRYTAIIEGNAKQAAADMARVMDIEIQAEQEKLAQFKAANEYALFSSEFYQRHGRHLIGTMSTWFLLDIAFYSQNLTQKDIYPAMGLIKKEMDMNALQEVLLTSRAMFVVALFGTFPGYWFTVFFIEKIGRFKIQLVGFFMMSFFMFVIGVKYDYLKDQNKNLFALLYGLTFFFANFGPNSTTFVLPAELFPTRVRSTCHALSAAAGKAGAMVGAFGIQNYTLDGDVHKIKKAMMILAVTNLLGFFCSFLVTETKGRSLEEISGEDDRENEFTPTPNPNKMPRIGVSEFLVCVIDLSLLSFIFLAFNYNLFNIPRYCIQHRNIRLFHQCNKNMNIHLNFLAGPYPSIGLDVSSSIYIYRQTQTTTKAKMQKESHKGRMGLAVVNALDSAPTQRYHMIVIAITGITFFTEAYDLFSFLTLSKLLSRFYYSYSYSPSNHILVMMVGVALLGSLSGTLFFGFLGDKLGRKKLYNLTLILLLTSAICSSLSIASSPNSVMTTLCFFRFWLGFGIGGDYPLSATIMSEYANKATRGAFLATVFSMQGLGFLCAGFVSMFFSTLFVSEAEDDDFVWRIVLIIGAIPALLTFYLRTKMPETGHYTALVQGNAKQAEADMASVLDLEERLLLGDHFEANAAEAEYSVLSKEFWKRHGLHLIGTMSTWFLSSVVFYSLMMSQKDLILPAIGLVQNKAEEKEGLEEVYETSRGMCVIGLLWSFPGYVFAVLFIEKIGRLKIQLVGFYIMGVLTLVMALKYEYLKQPQNQHLLALLFALMFFYANFGPNCTTFVLSAELFPTRLRSTCHSLSAAAGKLGAMIATYGIGKFSFHGGDMNKTMTSVMWMLTITNLMGFLLTTLLTETKGRSLKEISGEDDKREKKPRRAKVGKLVPRNQSIINLSRNEPI